MSSAKLRSSARHKIRRTRKWCALALTIATVLLGLWSILFLTDWFTSSANLGISVYNGNVVICWRPELAPGASFLAGYHCYSNYMAETWHFSNWKPAFRFNPPYNQLTIPIWLPLMMGVLVTAWLFLVDRRRNPAACPVCGYNLTGNVSGRCPECGTFLQATEKTGLAEQVSGGLNGTIEYRDSNNARCGEIRAAPVRKRTGTKDSSAS